MEEGSEKRRERLQSLRAQAAAGASPGPPPPPSPQLSNPLIQPSPASSPASIQRFDYYTDPMSAFSGNKRRGSSGHHHHPRNPRPRGYSPSTQYHMNHSPNQDLYQIPSPAPQNYSGRSPVQFGNPNFGHVGGQFYGHHDINASVHSPAHGGFRTPMMNTGIRSPHPGRFHSSPRAGMSSGRSRGPGRGGGRGLGYYGGSTSQEQENFYKSMVEDPWRDLKPVVGNILVPRAGSDFWLPKSIASKNPSVSETANRFKHEASLAEYLALSMEDTVSDDTVS